LAEETTKEDQITTQEIRKVLRKEPKLLLADFGTLNLKSSIYDDGRFHEYNAIIRNQVYYISPEKAERINKQSHGEVHLESGFFTLKEIQEKKLLFQSEPIYVQLDAIPRSVEILVKSYQNMCEQTEVELGLEQGKVTHNLREWSVVVAIAAFETREAMSSVEAVHIEALKILGFKSAYINTQIMYDYISQINHMKELGLQEGYGFIVNIGGGDTEIAAISGVPLMHTFRRFPLAGQDVTMYCERILQEELKIPGVMINTIEEWLMDDGTVLKDAPPTMKIVKRNEVNIQKLLNSPALLFDYKAYYNQSRKYNSITEIVRDSIEAVIMTSSFDDAVAMILSAVIIVGGGANYNGIANRLEAELKSEFPEYMNDINVIAGDNPQMCGINGMRALIRMKYKENERGLNFILF